MEGLKAIFRWPGEERLTLNINYVASMVKVKQKSRARWRHGILLSMAAYAYENMTPYTSM